MVAAAIVVVVVVAAVAIIVTTVVVVVAKVIRLLRSLRTTWSGGAGNTQHRLTALTVSY